MIKRENLIRVGQINKPHGIKGELSITFFNELFDENNSEFLICEIDGIFVPFQLENYRFKSNSTALVKFKGIDSEGKAKVFTNMEVYIFKDHITQDISSVDIGSWDYFIGFEMIDETLGRIGEILDVDETTINVLFVVNKDDREMLIPAVEGIITSVDENAKELHVVLPDGLVDL